MAGPVLASNDVGAQQRARAVAGGRWRLATDRRGCFRTHRRSASGRPWARQGVRKMGRFAEVGDRWHSARPSMSKDSFASLMANGSASVADRARKRLDRGQVLDGTVIQVSSEFVYVDVGTPGDGKIPVAELSDENGKLRVKVGDTVRASVIEAHMTGSLLRALQSAQGKDIPKPDEVLGGKVTRVENYGVFVNTAKGDGLVPVRELGRAPACAKPSRSAKS